LGPSPPEVPEAEEDTPIIETDLVVESGTTPPSEPLSEHQPQPEPQPHEEREEVPEFEPPLPECEPPIDEMPDAPVIEVVTEEEEPIDMVIEEPERVPTTASPPESRVENALDVALVDTDGSLSTETSSTQSVSRVFLHNVVTALDQRFRGTVETKVHAVEEQVGKLMDYLEPVIRSQPGRPTNSANMRTAMLERTVKELGELVDQLQFSIDETKAVSTGHKDTICEIMLKVIKRMKEMEATFAVFMIPPDNKEDTEAALCARNAVKLISQLEARMVALEALSSTRVSERRTLEDRFALMEQQMHVYTDKIAALERSNIALRGELEMVRTAAYQRPVGFFGGQSSNSSSPVNASGRITPVSRRSPAQSSPARSSPAQSPQALARSTSPVANAALAASGFLDSLGENGFTGSSFFDSMEMFENSDYMFTTLNELASGETTA